MSPTDKIKIGVFPADLAGCGHYRLIWPGFALQAEGVDVTVVPPNDRKNMFSSIVEDGQVVALQKVPDQFDVVVLQRITHKYLAQSIPLIRERGIAVVIDMDDDLETIHPSNPAWAMMHPRSGGSRLVADHSWHWAKLACDNATLVTVSSDRLLRRYARNAPGVVIRNYVPEEFLAVPRVESAVIGWGGSIHSHPDDLPVVGTAIAQLVEKGAEFKVIGPATGVAETLRLQGPVPHTGAVQIEDWPAALATLGIGIAPLADTEFNMSKSWLKPLEYASVGVPCVMSPRAEYVKIKKLGIGILAEKPRDWRVQLARLVLDPVYREDFALTSRLAATKLTVQQHAHEWGDAWGRAAALRGKVPPRPPASVFGLDRPRQTTR